MRKSITIKTLVITVAIAGAIAALPCRPAKAAGVIDHLYIVELDVENVPNFVGLGVGLLPDYSGSNNYTWGLAPFGRYTFSGQERYIQLLGNEVTINLVDDNMFHVGPLVNYHFGRSDSVEDAEVSRMEEIDDTFEVGAFANIIWAFQSDRRQRFILGVRLYQDVGDVSDGFRANFSARYWQPVAKPVDLNFSAGFIYQSDKYADTYHGVNPSNVGTSGLAFFEADGGLNEYYGIIGTTIYLTKNWIVGIGVRGSILADNVADSPIVDQRGSSTQWIGGVGVGYAIW